LIYLLDSDLEKPVTVWAKREHQDNKGRDYIYTESAKFTYDIQTPGVGSTAARE